MRRECTIFSSFLYLPSGRRQNSKFGDRLQCSGHNCTDEPFLGVAWTLQAAEKENCLFSGGVQSGFYSCVIFIRTILTLFVCCILWERVWLAVPEMTGIWVMYIMWNILGKSVFDGSTSRVDKVHLLLQSTGVTITMKYGCRYFTKYLSLIFSLRCCNFKHCEFGVDRGTQ